jgi:peptidoglycan hydrolase-like protein with peptidoglycan-binding domain
MKIKKIATAALMASVALSPLSPISAPARADGKDFIAGAIIGGLIGGAVANENNKKKAAKSNRSTKTKSTKSSISAEQREANREVQTALNYFGYGVGTPDGSIGPKSRAAISNYQAFLGYPASGQLTEHERTILVTSYHRAVAGGPVIASTVSGSVLGLKAVLIAQRDEMAGIAPGGTMAAATGVPAPGSVGAAAAAALPTLIAEDPVAEEVAAAPVVEAAAAEGPALPSFMDPAGAKGSLASECNQISLATTANGGLTTADGMLDANFALGEQFCLARSFAISKGDELTGQIAGFTPDQIAEQCAAFGPVLKDHVAALSLKPAAEVLGGVEGFILSSGMSPAQLSGTAKVCLGVGYAKDDLNVAIGSALLLAAMGERGYSEYLGHHLSQGFGATERPDLALDWYQMSLDAMEQGQTVVAPGVEGRDAVIKKASYTINGRASELEPEVGVQEAALPVFEVIPEPEAVGDEAAVVPLPQVPAAAPAETEVAALSPEAVPVPVSEAAPNAEIMNSGMQAAIIAARLPLLVFSGN